jgi:hypothetical protein
MDLDYWDHKRQEIYGGCRFRPRTLCPRKMRILAREFKKQVFMDKEVG